MDTLTQQLERDGYCVIEGVLDGALCELVFQQIIQHIGGPERWAVHEPEYRVHSPLPLNQVSEAAIRAVVKPAFEALTHTLLREQLLVELSSLTVFPGAQSQVIHRDSVDRTRFMISIFVNLLPTRRGAGALKVKPGSHVPEWREGDSEELYLALPAGSAVYMNSKLLHAGSENDSIDSVRPLFYCTFGDSDIAGAAYSIRAAHKNKLTLKAFWQPEPTAASEIRFVKNRWVAFLPPVESPRLLLIHDGRIEFGLDLGTELWLLRFFEVVARAPVSVAALTAAVGEPEESVLAAATQFGDLGVLTWEPPRVYDLGAGD